MLVSEESVSSSIVHINVIHKFTESLHIKRTWKSVPASTAHINYIHKITEALHIKRT
jgi:hypothetical protein